MSTVGNIIFYGFLVIALLSSVDPETNEFTNQTLFWLSGGTLLIFIVRALIRWIRDLNDLFEHIVDKYLN